jgi:hypothetical protein
MRKFWNLLFCRSTPSVSFIQFSNFSKLGFAATSAAWCFAGVPTDLRFGYFLCAAQLLKKEIPQNSTSSLITQNGQ